MATLWLQVNCADSVDTIAASGRSSENLIPAAFRLFFQDLTPAAYSVALMQLRFASLVVINLRRDLHPQECAHAGRT